MRRCYHAAGRRLQVDAQQQHFRVVLQAAPPAATAGGQLQQTEAVVGASSMVGGWLGGSKRGGVAGRAGRFRCGHIVVVLLLHPTCV